MPFSYTVHSYEDLSPRVRLIRMTAEDEKVPFECGQYVKIIINGYDPRPFSIASTPENPDLEFYISRPAEGEAKGSLREFLTAELCAGQKLEIDGPFGQMMTPPQTKDEQPSTIYGLAGGTGIAPIAALITKILEQGHDGQIVLYYGVRDEEDLFVLNDFQNLAHKFENFRYEIILSDAADHSRYRRGFAHEALIQDLGEDADLSAAAVYLSGPPVMVSASLPPLLEKKLRAENLHTDRENLGESDLAILAKAS